MKIRIVISLSLLSLLLLSWLSLILWCTRIETSLESLQRLTNKSIDCINSWRFGSVIVWFCSNSNERVQRWMQIPCHCMRLDWSPCWGCKILARGILPDFYCEGMRPKFPCSKGCEGMRRSILQFLHMKCWEGRWHRLFQAIGIPTWNRK